LIECLDKPVDLVGRENPDAPKCARERLRAANVGEDQPLVEVQGA
jgi:hypothetical protein